MATKGGEDSKPFICIRDDAEEFQNIFESNIQELITLLDSKITELITGSDSTHSPFKEVKRLNAHMEFSKAKYEIFMALTSRMEDMEQTWVDKLTSLRSTFLENVEIFLASTKLDLKSTTVSPSKGFKKGSPALPKGILAKPASPVKSASSLYPAIPIYRQTAVKLTPSPTVTFVHEMDEESEDSSSVEEEPMNYTHWKEVVANKSPGRSSRSKTINESIIVKPPEPNVSVQEEDYMDELPPEVIQHTPSRTVRNAKKPIADTPVPTGRGISRKSILNSAERGKGTPTESKTVHFSVGMDVTEDLDIYSPEATFTKSTPRRKTVNFNPPVNTAEDLEISPEITRSKSKRKTMYASTRDPAVVPSPKRLKRGRSSLAPVLPKPVLEKPSNHSESDEDTEIDNYTPWVPLSMIDGSVPTEPGIYELKSAQAKRPAYIGAGNSLRTQLTIHKMQQKCGHKQLEKFIERNINHLQARYEVLTSGEDPKTEQKVRVKNFVTEFKTTPAYN